MAELQGEYLKLVNSVGEPFTDDNDATTFVVERTIVPDDLENIALSVAIALSLETFDKLRPKSN